MQTQAYICLFGQVRLFFNGRSIEHFHTSRCRDLIGLLAISPGKRIDRQSLVRLLWPDDRSAKAANRLSVTLYLLKKDLQRLGLPVESIMKSTPKAVQLNDAEIECDYRLFTEAVELARADPTRRRECYQTAFDLYLGPLLPETETTWADLPRVNAERMYQEAALWLATNAGDPGAARDILRQSVAVDPWGERTAETLLLYLLESNDIEEATAYCQQLKASYSLRGAEPPASLLKVMQRIVQRSPSRSPKPNNWPVSTTCSVNSGKAISFMNVSEEAAVYGNTVLPPGGLANPLVAHEMAIKIIGEDADAKVLIHSEIRDPLLAPSRALNRLFRHVPLGAICSTPAATELLRVHDPSLIDPTWKKQDLSMLRQTQ